jgi:hypothetical protein
MNEKYNPDTYIIPIREIIDKALRNGMAVELVDNKLSIVNTVAEIKSTIDLAPWVDEISFVID